MGMRGITMSEIISDSVRKLSEIIAQTPVDWAAFDSVLKGIEDINVCDPQLEETILSELILNGNFFEDGENLPEIVRHFLACGYDPSANGGMNGVQPLEKLCWSSYDRHILDAAKELMNARSLLSYINMNGEPEELLDTVGFKLSGAWTIDEDPIFANVLEAYYAMTKANIAGKDYNSIENYSACIGKKLTSVSIACADGSPALHEEESVSVYSEPLVMWFEDKPLVVRCEVDFVVNPVYVDDEKSSLADVTTAFSALIGAALKDVRCDDIDSCLFEFDDGKNLLLASRNSGEKSVGTFEIRTN